MTKMKWSGPISFEPVYQEKVWGGRRLESVYGRRLPKEGVLYGESWELVDREKEQVAIQSGPAAGRTLNDLWMNERRSVFGCGLLAHSASRCPLLVKILDARDDLSIQVHPPASAVASVGGEPKSEMWYIAHADPGAKLYVGLREGVTRTDFEGGINGGRTRDQVHVIEPSAGEFIFIPSGRLHAIGAGLLIYEIQQNSDTTFRVYDWDRPGTDGKLRQLHVDQSLKCIDFTDVEPRMGVPRGEVLVECEHFQVRRRVVPWGETTAAADDGAASVVTVVTGEVRCGDASFRAGDFFLVPAEAEESVRQLRNVGSADAQVLLTSLPDGS